MRHPVFVGLVAASLGLVSVQPARAQGPQSAQSAGSVQPAVLTEGEIKKVDTDAMKLTLKHGDIKNLGMPGMTMVFAAADPKMLEGLKAGDKVRFGADRVNGVLTVTSIETKNEGDVAR